MSRDEPVVLTDPIAVRALAHPARLAVIEELYSGRQLTATECAEIAGLSPSAMSYHLRNLERCGIVERAATSGDGRERPWRAAGSYLRVDVDTAGMAAADTALTSTLITRLAEQFGRYQQRQASEPRAWRRVTVANSGQVWLTPEELEDIGAYLAGVAERYRGRRAGSRPAGARRVRLAAFAFPMDPPAATRARRRAQ